MTANGNVALVPAGDFLCHAFALMHVPYVWGGKTDKGIDCSGLVTLAYNLAGGPNWLQTRAASTLWAELPRVSEPLHEVKPGHLVFYGRGPSDIYHVGIVLPYGMLLEAGGGDHTTTTTEEALRRGAEVRVRRSWQRSSLQGFRALALDYTR